MKIKKSKRGFLIDFYHPVFKKRIRKVASARTKEEAANIAESWRRQMLESSGQLITQKKSVSIENAIRLYKEERSALKRPSSQELDNVVFNFFSQGIRKQFVAEIQIEDILSLIKKWREDLKYKASSINRYLNTIKNFLSWCYRKNWIQTDIGPQIKHIKGAIRESRPLTKEEISTVYLHSSRTLKLQIEIALATGLRAGEISHLKWSSVDFERNRIKIGGDSSFTAKNGHSREVYLPPSLKVKFIELKLSQGNIPWIFPNLSKSGPTEASVVTRAWIRARMAAKVKDVKFHDLRATAAVNYAEQGLGDAAIARLLGHRSSQMARKYSNSVQENILRQATEKAHQSFLSVVSPEKISEVVEF